MCFRHLYMIRMIIWIGMIMMVAGDEDLHYMIHFSMISDYFSV